MATVFPSLDRMEEGQVKTRMYLMQSIDWILFIAVISYGVYAFLYAESKLVPALITMAGLLVVHWVGNYISDKSAVLRVNLNILKRSRSRDKE